MGENLKRRKSDRAPVTVDDLQEMAVNPTHFADWLDEYMKWFTEDRCQSVCEGRICMQDKGHDGGHLDAEGIGWE